MSHHEKTITVGGVDYTVNWDDDRTDNPDDITYAVYDCQGRCMGEVIRSFHTTSSYYNGYTYWKRGATRAWDVDTGAVDMEIIEHLDGDALTAWHDDLFDLFTDAVKGRQNEGRTSTWLTIVKHFIEAFDAAMVPMPPVEDEIVGDWTDEELCCGIIWAQVERFSNIVKHCPCCGDRLSYIPKEALE